MRVRPSEGFVRRWTSIQTQLLAGAGFVLALAGAIALTGYLGLRALQQGVQDTIEAAGTIREQSLRFENDFLLARQSELSFLSEWRAIGFQAAAKHLTANRSHLEQARNRLDALRRVVEAASDPILRALDDEIDELRPLLDTYQQNFVAAVADIEARSRSGGLESELRDYLDQLTTAVSEMPEPALRELALEMSASEQSYLGTGRPEYVDKLRLLFNKFRSVLESAAPTDLRSEKEGARARGP